MKSLPVVLACSLVLVTACGRIEQQATTTPANPTTEQDKRLATLLASLEKADKIIVYEGLPHQFYQPELVAEQQKEKETLTFQLSHFYKKPLELKPPDLKKLQAGMVRVDSFNPWSGEKLCGGFHADYCVEWDRDGQFMRALICFGCAEMLLAEPNQTTFFDLNYPNFGPVGDILLAYRQNRPDSKDWAHVNRVHAEQKKLAQSR